MSAPLLPDDLWNLVAPLLPPEPPRPKGGRPRVSDRAALTGILFVFKTGCPWQMLPGEATGPNPTDRGRPGTKHHLLVDRTGVPLAALISPAN